MQRDAALRYFTHLNTHSHYTLLGATPSVGDLVAQAVSDGLTHLALTDTNALYGCVSFSRTCSAAGIVPIIGMTLTVAQPNAPVDRAISAGQLVLLARGPDGYTSLCRLSSAIQGRPDRRAAIRKGIGWDLLKEHQRGLVCLSGGRRGWIEQMIRSGDRAGAARYASQLSGIFGEQAFLTLERHGQDSREDEVCREVLDLSARFGMATVAVQPIFCMYPEEKNRLRLLTAIDLNCTVDDVPSDRLMESGEIPLDLHWLSPDVIVDRFHDCLDAVAQAGMIANSCESAIPDGKPIWPVLALPANKTPDQALADLAENGLAHRYPNPETGVRARLAYELDAISTQGYAPLFLLVADIVRHARTQGVPFSSRGSVANSLVAYCSGITSVDPISHDLLFERFLNPERVEPPDIDLDFCSRRRDEILDYVRHRYGDEKVALVATIATMQPKSAIRETGKAYALDDDQIRHLVNLVRDRRHPDPRRSTQNPAQTLLDRLDDERLCRVVVAAYDLVGMPHHLSVHPGGVIVTPGSLTDVVPVQWAPKGFLITQLDHHDVEAIGLPKIDLLGIRALTVLADAADLVQKHQNPDFRLADIPQGDVKTGELLSTGDSVGVFQCESSGAQRTLRQLQVRNVRDLAVANAFFKPGPATGGMASAFVRRYRGEEKVSYLHPALAQILAQTQGVLLFQEQILRVATEIAGLSWGQADRLRRGMSKFRPDEMAATQDAFIAGCTRLDGPGLNYAEAQTLWEQVEAFAGYGFNQGHATAYADVSYRSAYLKTHWPAEFLCARLADPGGFHHQAVYIAEAIRRGIDVRPPHINHSPRRFSLEWVNEGHRGQRPRLWMGLAQVRDVRMQTVQKLIAERTKCPFRNLHDLMSRVSIRKKEAIHLVQCGALDGLGTGRAALVGEITDKQGVGNVQQIAFDFALSDVNEESAAQRVAWEKRILGQPVSVHPLACCETDNSQYISLQSCMLQANRSQLAIGVRLPGWTGSKSWFLADESTYIFATCDRGIATPKPWVPIAVSGTCRRDRWGGVWFQVTEWEEIAF